jgi:hypothetical protein
LGKVEPNPLLEKVEQKSKPFRNPLLGNPLNIWVIGLNMEVNFPTMDLAPHGSKAPVSPHFAPLFLKVDFLKVEWIF